MRALVLALLVSATAAGPAVAHGSGPLAGWSFEPLVILPLVASLGLFAAGWIRLRRRSGRGGARLSRRGLWFFTGWLLLAGAVVSPLHHAGMRSFAAHMVEHELLMLAAAPLLVLGRPLPVMLWSLPTVLRVRLGRWSSGRLLRRAWEGLTAPWPATLLQACALWVWHVPALFDRALANPVWHVAQHLSFLLTALLFWAAVLPGRGHRNAVAVLCLFTTSLVSGALGAMMAFAASPWYGAYAAMRMAPFGLSPLEDQQLAGMLMWVPGGLVHAAAALLVLSRILRSNSITLSHGHVHDPAR